MTKVRQDGLDRYKLAVRTWSDQDANVRETFMKAYQSRLKFIGQFFQRFGFHGKDADIRTEVLLCFMIWGRCCIALLERRSLPRYSPIR